jgi:UDP-N-acetylmuramyl tripeptide synthase
MLAGKTLRFLLRLVRRGGGSALPGTLAFKIQPKLLEKAIASAPLGLVVVSGTAGKSSTTKVLVELLRAHGLKVFTNPSTANIRQGFYASVLQFGNLLGKIDADIAVMEWDEGHGAIFAAELKPRLAVLTNVLSDQLDRFVDPVFVQKKLEAIAISSQVVIANRDDKNITQIVSNHPEALGFGLSSSVTEPHPEYALNFGEHQQLPKSAMVTHADDVAMSIKIGDSNIDFTGDFANLPQALNISAALLAASKLIKLDAAKAKEVVETMPPVFARDEMVDIAGRKVRLMLVQNPTSFQLNLNKFAATPSPLMMMAGRDIHDPSWLWTVNFDGISRVDIVSGFNAYELALRLHFANVEIGEVIPEIDLANDRFSQLEGDSPTIVFSADAMRRTRRYLRLAK